MSGPVPGPDGELRCPWGMSAPEYVEYHDEEWGRPLPGDNAMFERLALEAFQSGLSWLTILRKRESFRRAFAGFDIDAVAAFTGADRQRLLQDASIVRNRAKIDATLANAKAAQALDESLTDLIWGFAPPDRPAPMVLADVPAVTAESTALAKELKRRGFAFIGPTTAYALMQAVVMVNDHLADCWVRERD